VYRGESPQKGRYRGFTQADIDIVGSSSMDADAEVIAVIYRTLKNLGIENFYININNRKILNALPQYARFPEKKLVDVLRILDKTDKIGEKKVMEELKKVISAVSCERIENFLTISGNADECSSRAKKLFSGNTMAQEGIQELEIIAKNLNWSGIPSKNWRINFQTVRGLGYYTGPVFETFLPDYKEIGSIFSGGRYDNLVASFTGERLPAVGASTGIDRFIAALDRFPEVMKKKATTTAVLILNLSSALAKDYFTFANELRNAGINTTLYLGDDRAFQAQFAYAVKKEIPFVVIYGENEKKKGVVAIKNLTTREQKEIAKEGVAEFFRNLKEPS
jgi:histidyl-tRNA synthetase